MSVPSFKGKTLRDARKAAIAIGLSIEASPSTLGDDAVIQSQNPVAGTPLHKGGGVGVSDAATMPSQTSVMPDLTGKTASEVVSALFEAGLNPTYSSGDLLGLASSQGVPPGTTVARWSRVVVAFTRETVQ